MAKADWESDDFEPEVFQKSLVNTDRWDGEDEEDNIKDNWDDDEEEKEKEKSEEPTMVATQPKKKKSLAQILAEKEEKRRKELEEKMKQEEEGQKTLTPEEIFSEKLRQQKLQEEADLELTKETFGVADSTSNIDQLNPTTREDFEAFRKELVDKITKYDSSPYYVLFLEDFCRDICLSLQHEDIKKITSNLNALAAEKQKALKPPKAKKRSKKGTMNATKGSLMILDYGDEFDDIGI